MHRHHLHAITSCALAIVRVVEVVWVDAASAPQGESTVLSESIASRAFQVSTFPSSLSLVESRIAT